VKKNARHVMFSKKLKEGTSKSHSAAENTKFVSSFLRGVLDPEEYRKLLANFYFVYDTMEREVKSSKDPIVGELKQWSRELNRVPFLERDLLYYYGPNWKDVIEPSSACDTYCWRIKQVAHDEPYLLVAHHYTRYIGDLSGGQILRKIAEKALKPPLGEGLMFYEFPCIDDAKEWKTNYKSVLDSMEFNTQEENALITEANYAFRLNMYMFDEVQGSATKSLLKVLWGFLTGK